jgi:sarcosine oxidase/L-pipecolate oxidase
MVVPYHILLLAALIPFVIGETILIAGGGTIGLSTAYWLSRYPTKYSHIKILDPYSKVSFASAGYDINKVIRTEYETKLYSNLADEAIKLWQNDPVFSPNYVKAGFLSGTYLGPNSSWDDAIRRTKLYGDPRELCRLEGNLKEIFNKDFPVFSASGPPVGFRGAYNGNGGWANATGALDHVSRYLSTQPHVQFVGGQQGTVKTLVKEKGVVVGVRTADGIVHRADKVILSMGAWSGEVLDFEGQAWPESWMVTHIELSPEEVDSARRMPVLDIWDAGENEDQIAGTLFPPNSDGLLKVAAHRA